MTCPTCDHTLHNITIGEGVGTFWCPRCGTLSDTTGHERPKLAHEVYANRPKSVTGDSDVTIGLSKDGSFEVIKVE